MDNPLEKIDWQTASRGPWLWLSLAVAVVGVSISFASCFHAMGRSDAERAKAHAESSKAFWDSTKERNEKVQPK